MEGSGPLSLTVSGYSRGGRSVEAESHNIFQLPVSSMSLIYTDSDLYAALVMLKFTAREPQGNKSGT